MLLGDKMTKTERFCLLANAVAECKICEQMPVNPCDRSSEKLSNIDRTKINVGRPFVNLWNLWQGDLDAEIMIIGQDFGDLGKGESDNTIVYALCEEWKSRKYTNATEKNLERMVSETFGKSIGDAEFPLFITNVANCYRKNATTGEIHPGWLPLCANKFMFELVDIIQPKIIIVLGRAAFEAMHCLDGAIMECTDAINSVKGTYAEMINHRYVLKSNAWKIPVFPVYHPGANSNRNRSSSQQKADWKRIADEWKYLKM